MSASSGIAPSGCDSAAISRPRFDAILTDPQRQLPVAAVLGHGGQQRHLGRAGQFLGERAVEDVGQALVAGALQQADCPHRLAPVEPVAIGGRRVGRRDDERPVAEPLGGELAVEGRAEGGRLLEIGLRVARGRPARPSARASRRPAPADRPGGDPGDPLEMPCAGRRVAQAAQRIQPAWNSASAASTGVSAAWADAIL